MDTHTPLTINVFLSSHKWVKSQIITFIPLFSSLLISSLLIHGDALSDEQIFHYNIPAQSLNNALVQFATYSNLELIFTTDMVRGHKAKALSGDMTEKAALEYLLQDSGYGYRFINVNTVTIIPDAEPIDSGQIQSTPPNNHTLKNIKVLQPLTVLGKSPASSQTNSNSSTLYSVTHSNSATKTNTPIKEIPQSIQILPRPIIDDQQNLGIGESLRNISGVVTGHALITPSFDSTLIRGFKAEQLIDGFTQYYNPGDRESLINIERIEVLKGPNALLYGGGSGSPAGGLVNIVSKLPQSIAHYELGMKYGSYQFYQPFFDLNQPINNHILFRVTGEYTHSESHIDTIKTERYNINPALILTDNDDTTFTLQGKLSDWEQPDYQGLPAVGTVSGDFTIKPDIFVGPANIESSEANFYGVWGTLEHSINETWSLSLKARYTESEFDQKVQALFGSDGFQADIPILLPSTWALSNSELFQEQEEISFVANTVAKFNLGPTENTLLLGADYSEIRDQGFLDFDSVVTGFVDLATPEFPIAYKSPGPRTNTLFIKNITYGGYLQAQSKLYGRLHLLAGLRLGNVTIDYKNTVPGFGFSSKTSKTKLLPRLGATFDFTNEFSLFFNYSEGMRGQSFANFNDKPEPELSRHIEGGIKFDIADQLTGQLAVYQIDRTNILVTNNSGALRSSSLDGKQRSRGLETDLIWQTIDSVKILANYAYTNARFSNDQSGISAGTPLASVPKHSGRLWANYHFQNTLFSGLNIGAGIYAQSGVYVSNVQPFKTDSYYTVDASLLYEIDNYKLGVSIKNLTDENYFERIEYLGGSVAPAQGTSVFANFSVRY